MKFERQTIYKKYNKTPNDVSYLLVLNADRTGMTFVYLTDEKYSNLYRNIDGLYFEELNRSVAITRVLYLSWNKTPVKYYEKYRSISNREMRKITTAMKELFDGDIVYDKDWNMCYSDEIKEDAESISTCAEEDQIPDNKLVEEVSTDQIIAPASDDAKEDQKTIEIDHDAPDMKNDVQLSLQSNTDTTEVTDDGTNSVVEDKYVDLLKMSYTSDDEFKASKRKGDKRKNKRISGAEHKRYYSETDALAIAHMRNLAIMEKYNVPSSVASTMKKNACEYFGLKNITNTIDKSAGNRFSELFDKGFTLDQVLEKFPSDSNAVKKSYKLWFAINKSQKKDDYKDRLDQIIDRDDIDELIKINNMTISELIQEFGCPINFAENINYTVRSILAKKSILFPVFGSRVFNEAEFNEYIDKCRNSKKSIIKLVEVLNFETCMRLADEYYSTFDKHHDIIIGAEPIPKTIKGDDKLRFINIIRRRFTQKLNIKNNDRCIEIIKKKDIAEYATIAMCQYGSANSYIQKWHKTNT